MESLGNGLKKIILAGIGTAATTAEKSKEILDDMVKKGELTVEQGKVLNQELKHNIKKTVKEKVNGSQPVTEEDMDELLGGLSEEQLEKLKEKLNQMEIIEEVDVEVTEVTDEAEEAEQPAETEEPEE